MNRLLLSAAMAAREMLRNRTAVALLFLVPTTLYVLIHATTGERAIPFQLSGHGNALLEGSERDVSLLFMGTTGMCGLLAFVAFVLTWRSIETDRRLVFEGYRPSALLAAKMLVVACAAAIVALYVAGLLLPFYLPQRPAGVFLGFFLGGLIYGALGIVIGVLSRRDLDGILTILLLVNVDPGWLQNPVFYAEAHNRGIIHWLPAHHPSQLVMLSALTETSLGHEVALCGGWLLGLGLAAMFLYRQRIGIIRRWGA